MVPIWLKVLAELSLISALLCALLIVADILGGHPQKMRIMSWVWPVTALYTGPLSLWSYFRLGRTRLAPSARDAPDERARQRGRAPFWKVVVVAVTHCGAGCTLGDIAAEWAVFLSGVTIAGVAIWPGLITDFVAAFLLGIVFQYFSIAPMRQLHGWPGVKAALKADALSLTAFEVGLFGWMLLSRFVFFRSHPLDPGDPTYWFMMQIGMVIGFATAFPVNWWLVRSGLKEAM